MAVTWRNAALKKYIDRLPNIKERTTQRVAEYLAQAVSQHIVRVGAVDTGELRDSPRVTRSPSEGRRVVVRAPHGVHVNYGTYKMGARPFWEPAISETMQRFPEIAREEFKP